ncbi:MAG: carboxypeptidase-like regulatory domain-containing protein [Proteiniphilum sp.]
MKKTFMRYMFSASLCILQMLLSQALLGQISTSKIEGVVKDKDTGNPLAGVQVIVEGTRLGNITNKDGYYFVLDVPPGSREITFAYTGYQKTTVSKVLLLAGQTITVNANLSSAVIQIEGIVVEGQSEILIPRDNTSTKQRMTAEQLQSSPASKLEDLMVLKAGVQVGGEGGRSRGIRIRGGRIGEEAMVVDGVMVRNFVANPYRNGQGWIFEQEVGSRGEDTTPLEFSAGSVEEVDIITGGFQAEYGNAQSGIINIVTKEGMDRYKGDVRFTTDEVNDRTADYGYNQLQLNIGGPVPGVPNLFFHGSGEIQGMADQFPTHASEGFRGVNQKFVDRLNEAVRNDPVLGAQSPAFSLEMFEKGYAFWAGKEGQEAGLWSPGNPVRQPNNWQDRTLSTGKLNYSPICTLKIIGSHNFSRNQRAWDDDASYFNTGIATVADLPNRQWAPGETEIYVPQCIARRTKSHNLLLGMDWDFLRSSDRNASFHFRYTDFRSTEINNSSLLTNWVREDNTFMGWSMHDIPFEIESYPNRELPTDKALQHQLYPDGETNWMKEWPYHTPFGMITEHEYYYLSYNYTREKQNTYKGDLDLQWNRQNRAKAGFQITDFENRKFEIGNSSRTRTRNEFNYKPQMYAAYVQNRTDLGDFVFDYGIRYDLFKPKDNWGFRYGDTFGDIYDPQTTHSWSPRFDVGFPVTDRAQMRFSYGVFTQIPGMTYIYNSGNYGALEYSRTDAFESGISYLVSNDIALDIVGYYRDIDGNVAYKDFFRQYYMEHEGRLVRTFTSGYTNGDNGNIKGVDISLDKRFSNNFSFSSSYTLQFSRTTGSYPDAERSSSTTFLDVTTNETFTPPDELLPMDGDRTHVWTNTVNYMFPDDFKNGTLFNGILKNTGIYAIFSLQSGEPIGGDTRHNYITDADMRYLSSYANYLNYYRGRWYTNLDMRINKKFYLGGSRSIGIFSEIFNVLNHKNSQPYPSGYSYDSYLYVTGGKDLVWSADLGEYQRSLFKSDYNQDGVLSVEEAAKGAIAQSFMTSTMNKKTWGLARQVRFGVEFNF